MRYDRKIDRRIRRAMGKAHYESRNALSAKMRVNKKVSRFAQGLGSFDPLLDRYYVRSHFPPRDILTELGDVEASSKISLILAFILGIIVAKNFL